MNKPADRQNLLAEVLAEASPADFRAAMLAETLRLARRRRYFRRARQAAGMLAVTGILMVFVARQFYRPPVVSLPSAEKITKPAYQLVHTQPLSTDALIGTRKFSETQFAPSASPVVEVATTADGYHLLTDDELLALLADKPAALIRTGPHSEELVFANQEDRKLLMSN